MRRIFVAMESAHLDVPSLSMEEAEVMLDEAKGDAGEIEKDVDESERMLTVSQSLEDMAEIVSSSGSDEVDPATASLVNVATDLAVAGSDVAPEELVPEPELREGDENVAVESRRYRIATESMTESARSILNSVIEYVKKIWKQITDFFYKILGGIPMLRRKLESVRKTVEAASSKSLENDKRKFKLTSVASLQVGDKVATDASSLEKAFGELESATEFVFGEYVSEVLKQGEAAKKALDGFNADKSGASVASLAKKLIDVTAKLPAGKNVDRRKDFECKIGPDLLGGKSLMLATYKQAESSSDLAKLEKHRRSGLELVPTKEKTVNLAKEVDFATLSISQMLGLLDTAEKILDSIEKYRRGSKTKDLERVQKEIESATKAAAAEADKADNTADRTNFRALAGFNVAFARWASQPAVPLTNYALTGVRAVIAVVLKSCSQYK